MHVIAAKAAAFKEALSDDFKEYSRQTLLNAKAICSSLKNNNFENRRISKSEHSVGGIWISSGLLNKLNSDFSDAIVSKIRVYALNRLLCCALVEELAEISLLVGEPEIIRSYKFEYFVFLTTIIFVTYINLTYGLWPDANSIISVIINGFFCIGLYKAWK